MSARERGMEEVIDFVLRKNADHITAGLGSLEQESPLEALMRKEEGDLEGEEWTIRLEAFHQVLEFLFAEGPEPLAVIRRLYGIVKALKPELTGNMSCEDIALLCNDAVQWDEKKGEWTAGRATVSARIKRIYNGTLQKAGMRAAKAPFQKSDEAVRTFREAQKGNQNRNKNQKKRANQKAARSRAK